MIIIFFSLIHRVKHLIDCKTVVFLIKIAFKEPLVWNLHLTMRRVRGGNISCLSPVSKHSTGVNHIEQLPVHSLSLIQATFLLQTEKRKKINNLSLKFIEGLPAHIILWRFLVFFCHKENTINSKFHFFKSHLWSTKCSDWPAPNLLKLIRTFYFSGDCD